VTPGPTRFADQVRFGEDLELDLRAYELRKAGRAVKLERIPMDLLTLLVEHRGELLTRDQIIEKIWGKGVFLDADNSINSAIRKIRQALKDDPEQPRFVQTVSGRGYRFIAPITQITPSDGVPAREIVGSELRGRSDAAKTTASIEPSITIAPRKRTWLVAVAALAIAFIAAGLIAGGVHLTRARANRLTAEDTIVLGDFANSTGDPILTIRLRKRSQSHSGSRHSSTSFQKAKSPGR
jgi:DNA-binding winged helix-turn-helix (wHTH) protein